MSCLALCMQQTMFISVWLSMVDFTETESVLWPFPGLTREPVYSPVVFSELNLSSFIGWTVQPHWRKEDFADVLSKLVFTLHRVPGGIPNTSPVHHLGVRTAVCQDVGCARCLEERGGFQFRYVSSLFTPSAAFAVYGPGDPMFNEGKTHARVVCGSCHWPVGGLWLSGRAADPDLDESKLDSRFASYKSALESADVSQTAIMDRRSFRRMELRLLEQARRADRA